MTLKNLDNLVKVKKLKAEAPDQHEFDGMLSSAKRRLQDAQVEGLSEEGKFFLAYGATHRDVGSVTRGQEARSDRAQNHQFFQY